MRPYTTTVNMNHAALSGWLRDARHLLASTDTGHESLARLVAGDHFHDDAFARKVDNFNTRHGLQRATFGQEVMQTGYSKRHIALKNWGHDPSRPDSPLYSADQTWLRLHQGAAQRRNTRVNNPMVVSELRGPHHKRRELADFAAFLGCHAPVRMVGDGLTVTLVPEGHRLAGMESEVPLGECTVVVGVLRHYAQPSARAQRFAANLVSDLSALPVNASTEAHRELAPALEYGLATAFDRDRTPIDGREPNPPFMTWLMPVAQFIVSSGYFVMSSLNLLKVFSSESKPTP